MHSEMIGAANGKVRRILIMAGDTDGNLGDRAIVLATCDELKRIDPTIKITIFSANPEKDSKYFQVDTIPRGYRGGFSFLRTILKSDLVICGGGGLFQDDTSLVKMPYWAGLVTTTRLFTPNIAGFSLGIGPLTHFFSRLSARLAFVCMKTVSARDHLGRLLAGELCSKAVALVPDPALMLDEAKEKEADELLQNFGIAKGESPLIGVVVRRSFHQYPSLIPHKYAHKYKLRRIPGSEKNDKMIRLLATVFDQVAEQENATIVFMPTYNVAHEGDDVISKKIIRAMATSRKVLLRIDDPRLYKAVTGKLDVMLGGRMHPTIFAASMGVPVVGLSYNQKFEGFFSLLDCKDRVISIEDFVDREMVSELVDKIISGLHEPNYVSRSLLELVAGTRIFLRRILE